MEQISVRWSRLGVWVSVAVVLHESAPVTDNVTATQHSATLARQDRTIRKTVKGTRDPGDLSLLQRLWSLIIEK